MSFRSLNSPLLALVIAAQLATGSFTFAQPAPATLASAARLFNLNDQIELPGDAGFSLSDLSKQNIARFRASLGPLSTDELKLYEKVTRLPLIMTTRRSADSAARIAESGILPMEVLRSRGINVQSNYWVPTEAQLFGSSGWSFATVSAVGWKGLASYGGVVFSINKDYWIKNSWANPVSGLKTYETFAGLERGEESMSGIPAAKLQAVREYFKSQITAPEHFSNWIALDVVQKLRERDSSRRRAYFEANEKQLVKLMNEDRFGFLEAKLPGIPASALSMD